MASQKITTAMVAAQLMSVIKKNQPMMDHNAGMLSTMISGLCMLSICPKTSPETMEELHNEIGIEAKNCLLVTSSGEAEDKKIQADFEDFIGMEWEPWEE